jgi:hypothetical protein
MLTTRVPVEFWGHRYPGGDMQIKYNPKTKGWRYTMESAYRGDTPYSKWITETFKPNFEKKEGTRGTTLVRGLVFVGDVPIKMNYGLREYLEWPEEFMKEMQTWRNEGYKPNAPPEPDTSKYERDISLDTEKWQKDDAIIKYRGSY